MAVGGDQRIGLTLEANLDPSGVLNGVKTMQNGLNGLKIDPKLMSGLTKEIEKVNTLINKYQSQLAKGVNTKTDAKNLAKTGSEIQNSLDRIVKGIQEVNNTSVSLKVEDATKLKTLEDNLKNIKKQIQDTFQQKISTSGLSEAMTKFAAGTGRAKTVQNLVNKAEIALERQELEKFGSTLDEIKDKLSSYKGSTLVSIGKALGLNDLSSSDVDGAITKITDKIDELKTKATEAGDAVEGLRDKETAAAKAIDNFKPGAIERGKEAINDLATGAEKVPAAFNQIKQSADNAASGILDAKTQVEQLQQSTQYFFSLRNMINLLKRGIDEAVQSVKDLDKAMTETAVVTDYKVSDLWGMLPEYTKVANDLGATTQGAYETMTLYYQQGLEQQQAFELGAETMKMARIAGLDYAETTDMMTAALRGFNMELNEVSAKRVNDVYSELAAITASDTEELGTAMQRTASIAASAGASFEGTTAFLAQAIETTREPAENIGTAMKTIVARFQELKKNPLEISEVDGEEVDYNKIDTALKTIGVDLKDTNGQFRNFDEVMLDISARWDSLSQAQQRYIATTAAGSRQQSRFIAMVSNYDRTMQLMEAANNSAGASDEQFGKTMDSLESKLNQLHNAWQAFTMGIANNGMIKLAVDGLTKFLTVTNKIIDTLSMGSGAIKSFLSVFAAFTGLKAAGRIANRAIGGLGGLIDPQSTFKQGFMGGAIRQGQGQAQAKAISTPIVNSLEKISGQIANIAQQRGINNQGKTTQDNIDARQTSKEQYKDIKKQFDQLNRSEGFKMSEAAGLFGQLDEKHQLSMFNNNPGTKIAMQKASLDWFNSKGLSKELTTEGKGYIRSIYKGMEEGQIPVNKGIQLIGRPDLWGEHFGSDTAKAFSQNFTLTDSQLSQIQEGTWSKLGMKLAAPETREAWLKENQKKFDEAYKEVYNNFDFESDNIKGKVSTFGTFTNTIGALGDKFTQAGYAISSFGSTLSQLGGPLGSIGSMMESFGGLISSVGMGLSSTVSVVSSLAKDLSSAEKGVRAAAAATGTAMLFVGAIVAGVAIAKKQLKDINDAAQKVTDTYKETSKQTQEHISNLKSYRDEFSRLSKGVDSNGNNINLDSSDYERYLEIVDEIATINPNIVEGYNAQGHAIINNNKALAETLKLEEERQKTAIDNYTSAESLNKLLKARNYSAGFGKATALKDKQSQARLQFMYGDVSVGMQREAGQSLIIPMQTAVQDAAKKLQQESWFDESTLQKYGIESLDALINGEEEAVNKFVKYQDKINSEVSSAADAAGETMGESLVKSFDKLGEKTSAFNEAIQPVYDNLLTQFTNSPMYNSIPEEFKQFAMSGLKEIASQDWDATKMIQETDELAVRMANLTDESSEYSQIMEDVAEAQDNFAATLEETQYNTDVQPAIEELERLKEEALEEGTVYGNALAEYLETQIQQITHFTEEGTTTIQDGLNTATEAIAEAESALEGFNKATEKDFWTASEGMKSIYDKIFETYEDSYGNKLEKHTEGEGDNTFWTGAEALLSPDKLTGGVEAVSQSLKDLEPWLREGKEGMDAFFTDVVNNPQLKQLEKKGLIKLDENGWFEEIPEGQWENVANALGISEELLTSMLNKARQFGLISFDNLDKVREALATGNSAIEGINTNKAGQKELYVKEDTMRSNLREAGYNTKESQDKVIEQLAEQQNVHMVQTMENLTKQSAKDLKDAWGIKDLSDLITKMTETGEYNKEEILDFAEKAGLGSEEEASSLYDNIIRALDNPELAQQTSELQSINAKLDAIIDHETGKGVEDYEKQQKEDHESILGDEGIATNFAKGLDAEGKLLDSGSFAVVRKDLEETQKQYEETANYYKERAKYASEDDAERFNKLAELYSKDADAIKKAIKQGENAKKKLKEDNKDKRTTTKFKRDDNQGKTEAPEPPKPVTKKEAREANDAAQEKGQKDTEHYKAVMDLEEGPSFKKTEKKLSHWEEEQLGLDADIDVKGEEKLDTAEDSVISLEDLLNTPIWMLINSDYKEVLTAKGEIDKTQDAASKESTVKVGSQYQQVVSAKQLISSIAGHVFSASVTVGAGNAISTLTRIWNLISKIINNKSKATHIGGNGGRGEEGAAIGKHNHGYSSIPIVGSAARGGYGRLGPKGKGGPTLTGELGYEIAWLPSENRSMILGANGPQMIDLPGDAVVWTHEQSKKILKQKAIPAGSHSGPSATGNSSNYVITYPAYESVAQTYYTKAPKTTTKGQKAQQQADNAHVKAVKQMDYWWEKISRQVKTAERIGDRLGDKTTKILNDIRASVGDVNKINKTFIKAQKDSIALNQAIIKNSNRKLASLKKGSKNKSKDNWQTVEWQTKSGKKSQDHSQKMNLSNFIGVDANGTYYVDEKKINKKTSKGRTRSKAEKLAISEKTYELIDKWQDRRNDAQDAIDKAKDAIADYRKQIDDTFFGWENELTKIYKITGAIEKIEAKRNLEQSKYNLAQTHLDQENLSFGMTKGLTTYLSQMQTANKESIKYYKDEIIQKKKLISTDKKKGQLEKQQEKYGQLTNKKIKYESIDGKPKKETEKSTYKRIKSLKGAKQGSGTYWDELSEQEKRIYARGRAFDKNYKYIKKNKDGSYYLNTSKIEADRKAGKISEELYNLIKETYDNLHQYDLDLINTQTEINDLENERLQTAQEYKDVTNQLAEQLYGWKNTLTQILQLTYQIEQSEKRTSFLKSAQDYYEAKQNSGNKVKSTDILSSFTGQMISTVNQIQQRTDLVAKQRQDLQDYIKGTDINKQIKNLESLPKTEKNDVTKARINQLKEEKKIHDLAKSYVKTTNNADGTVSIKFDSKGLDKDIGKKFDAETASKIEEYAQELVNKNNELIETMSTNLSDITELYSTLADLKQQYADSAKELREAYGAQQQKIIDNLKTLYTAIDNSFKELINQVKQSIQQRRQEESNTKTEQDISKKQQRLAALRADTSGGNQVAIAQLQKEIADAQQSYGYTLEDQLIDKLSQQGDEAAKQRQKQIDLLQAQRDFAAKSGRDAELINQWLENSDQHETEIKEALQGTDWTALTQAEKKVFDTSLNNKLTTLNTLPSKMDIVQGAINATTKPEKTVQDQINGATKTTVNQASTDTLKQLATLEGDLGEVVSYVKTKIAADEKAKEDKKKAEAKAKEEKPLIDTATQVLSAIPTVLSGSSNSTPASGGGNGALRASAVGQATGSKSSNSSKITTTLSSTVGIDPRTQAKQSYGELLSARASKTKSKDKNWGTIGKDSLKKLIDWGATGYGYSEWDVLSNIANFSGSGAPLYGAWDKILKAYISYKGTKEKAAKAIKTNFGKNLTNKRKQGWKSAFGKAYPSYKTGGIANFTGPAWLDGTPSKPELVLDAKDTQNFLALRDVLDKALGSTSAVNNSYEGDVLYEININVDKIEKDYDVDRVVEKVKKEIVKGAGYRNVTQVRNFR